MVPLFGAVLTSLPENDRNLVSAWLRYSGLHLKEVNAKNWKDHSEGILFFSKSSPELAKELLEWSIEPLLCGNFDEQEKLNYYESGASLLWEESCRSVNSLPSYPPNLSYTNWAVYTANPIFDKHISTLLRSLGETVYVEGKFEHLLKRIQTSPIHLAILDWDSLGSSLPQCIERLKSIHKERQTLFLGLKDFDRDHLYRDLSLGISQISPSLFSGKDLLEVLARSLPVRKEREEENTRTSEFRRIKFEFQEKNLPMRYELTEEREKTVLENKEDTNVKNVRNLFRWLYGRSFEKKKII
ncbi:response regulator transcription factor [Leptospira idonii]|uniref:DNA-binding response regulator n=1 Tax=Leptospira idonii TaxID=1193500 RepID=A0A4R9M1D4_9LEPT|nr:response regulator transcription factor [Leptospira idonii]TGN20564.1 DNA-binding response regulator [Leptospira idonii]